LVKEIFINNFKIGGNNPFILIAGPCVIEDEEKTIYIAGRLKEISESVGISLIFKSSYDKANRTSIKSYRGPGINKGLKILNMVKEKFNIPVLSDIHSINEVKIASEILDVVQIPALLCRQTDIIAEAAKRAKVINIKKGQFMAPWDVKYVIEKALYFSKNKNIMVTERGVVFGYNNLVSDMRSIVIMRKFGFPVVFDVTHSLQLPGLGESSGGEREYIEYLAKAAVAVGVDAIFMEVHPTPDKALCDGPNSLKLELLKPLLIKLKEIDRIVKC
jgi:2-dehydro-3-deoxyphosphooctonate aldolase (KDO 8-P synthase)